MLGVLLLQIAHTKLVWRCVFMLILGWPLTVLPQDYYLGKQLSDPTVFPHQAFERITKMKQGNDGILWLATNQGLFTFDGIEFKRKTHRPNGFSALDNGSINDLFLDQALGQIWVAHEMGASMLDHPNGCFHRLHFLSKQSG